MLDRRILIIVLILLINFVLSKSCYAQNLVENGGFEKYQFYPEEENMMDKNVSNWESGLIWTTPDFFLNESRSEVGSDCFINNTIKYFAKSGNGFVGLRLLGKGGEAIQTNLTKPLMKDSVYEISFFIQLSKVSNYGIDRIQVDFSWANDNFLIKERLDVGRLLDGYSKWKPNVKYGDYESVFLYKNLGKEFYLDVGIWVEVKGTYKAIGGEQCIRIGNVHQSAYLRCIKENSIKVEDDKKSLKKMETTYKKLILKQNIMNGSYLSYYLIDDIKIELVK
jgi:hypothetical protein